MNIEINRTTEDELSCLKIKRTLTFRHANKNIFLFFVISLIFMVVNNHDSIKKNTFSANTLFGMIFLGFALILYYQTHILKNRKFQMAFKVINKFKDANNLKVLLTEEAFSVQTFKNYYSYYWKAINMFKIYKEHIILLNDSEYLTSVVIKKSELSKAEFDEFYSFLKSQNLKEL